MISQEMSFSSFRKQLFFYIQQHDIIKNKSSPKTNRILEMVVKKANTKMEVNSKIK
jgi:hypothetical protein